MVSPQAKGLNWYKSPYGNKYHLGTSGSDLYCDRKYNGGWYGYSTKFKKCDKPDSKYQVCYHCKTKAFEEGINVMDNFTEECDEGETETIDMLPQINSFAIRTSGNLWDIYEDGKKVGEFNGSAEMVKRMVE